MTPLIWTPGASDATGPYRDATDAELLADIERNSTEVSWEDLDETARLDQELAHHEDASYTDPDLEAEDAAHHPAGDEA